MGEVEVLHTSTLDGLRTTDRIRKLIAGSTMCHSEVVFQLANHIPHVLLASAASSLPHTRGGRRSWVTEDE